MVRVVSTELKSFRTVELLREVVRRLVDWALAEIEIRAALVVCNTRLAFYKAGRSLEDTIKSQSMNARGLDADGYCA